MSDPSARYEVANRQARLIEARVHALWTTEDADAYSRELAAEVVACPAASAPVLVADHRPVRVYPPEVTDHLVSLFEQMNARLERIAILVSETNATMYLQLERLVREAGFEKRRVFQDTEGALAHLAGGLDAAELARAKEFLAEWPGEG